MSDFSYTGHSCLSDQFIVCFGPFIEFVGCEKNKAYKLTYPLMISSMSQSDLQQHRDHKRVINWPYIQYGKGISENKEQKLLQ